MKHTYHNYIGKEPKECDTPRYLGKKWSSDPVDATEYRKIVGKNMYLVTKSLPEGGNAARDLTKHISNPEPDHWKSVGRRVGHFKKIKDKMKLTYREPKELLRQRLCFCGRQEERVQKRWDLGRLHHGLAIEYPTDGLTFNCGSRVLFSG